MFRHPRVYALVIMVLAAVAVGTALLAPYVRAPQGTFAPVRQTAVTLAAPPLLYNPDTFYEEPQQEPPAPPAPIVKPKPRPEGAPALVAIIIDDVGLSRAQTLPVIDLPPAVTLSFLPYGEHVADLADKAHAKGHAVMLHMPMQPKGDQNPGPEALTLGLDAATVSQRVASALSRVPHVVGINNHMGSAATSDQVLMGKLMAALKDKPLFFVDSYTSAESVAYQAAHDAGVTTARRDVFLDNDPARAAIDAQLQRLEHVARARGQAIAIGHPYPSTLAALNDWLGINGGGLDKRGIKLVSITEIMEKKQ